MKSPCILSLAGESPIKYTILARDYEYKRHGTLSLLASIDLLTGVITATVEDRHRSAEFVAFLTKLDSSYPEYHKIKIILDNHSSQISKETRKYPTTKPNRFEFAFTPTHASWYQSENKAELKNRIQKI